MARTRAASNKGKRNSRQLRAGDLTLDLDERCVVKDGHPIHLTFKECALLETLIRNGGEVLTRKQLMKEVWDTDYLGDTRTLDVHIRWLRTKVEQNPSKPVLIRTVRGVGYRFEMADGKPRSTTKRSP
jgi:two-component system response regulator RegX3